MPVRDRQRDHLGDVVRVQVTSLSAAARHGPVVFRIIRTSDSSCTVSFQR